MNYKKITLSIATILSLTSLDALEFKPVGFKAVGMGGAGVASTRGSLAGYYNPALLRFSDYTAEFSIDVGARVRESNLIDNVDKLNDLDIEQVVDNIGNNAPISGSNTANGDNVKMADALDILENIGTNNAFQLSVTPSFTAQMSDAIAIGVYANVNIGLRLNIDKDHLDLIFKDDSNGIDVYYQYTPDNDTYTAKAGTFGEEEYKASSLEYANNNGINYIQVDSMVLAEVPLSYAKAYDWKSGTWSFGINIKPMSLITTSERLNLGTSSDDASDDDSSYETTYKPTIGLDLGLAYRPKDSKMTIGLMGKNINTPTFAVDTSETGRTEDYIIDPMFRAGLSVPIWNDNIEFALDVDLTKNDTLIEGEQSQYVGAGIELHPASWFSLRVGAMQDIASEKFDDGTILTAGLGFGLKWAQLDISAMVGTNTGEYDGDTIPRYAAVNIALVSKWGDGYNKKQPPLKKVQEIENKAKDKVNNISPEDRARIKAESEKAYAELDKS
jgi:hypothetical protein